MSTIVSDCAPLCPIVSHYVPMWTIVSHCAPLCPIVSHYVPTCTIVSHCAPLFPTVPHCVSLFLIMFQCAPLCLTVPHCAPLFLIMFQCPPLCLTVPHCAPLCPIVSYCAPHHRTSLCLVIVRDPTSLCVTRPHSTSLYITLHESVSPYVTLHQCTLCQCTSFWITLRQCTSLCVTVCHSAPVCITHIALPLYVILVTLRHFAPLLVTVRHCTSLRAIVCASGSLRVTLRHSTSLCVTFLPRASLSHSPSFYPALRDCVPSRYCASLCVTARHFAWPCANLCDPASPSFTPPTPSTSPTILPLPHSPTIHAHYYPPASSVITRVLLAPTLNGLMLLVKRINTTGRRLWTPPQAVRLSQAVCPHIVPLSNVPLFDVLLCRLSNMFILYVPGQYVTCAVRKSIRTLGPA